MSRPAPPRHAVGRDPSCVVTQLSSRLESVAVSQTEAASDFPVTLRKLHLRIGLILLLSLLPASSVLASLTVETQLALVALPIALLGVMHGGLDPWVGEVVLTRYRGRCSRPFFFAETVLPSPYLAPFQFSARWRPILLKLR